MYSDYYVYDLEAYKNYFSCRITRDSDGAQWKFEISPWVHEGFALYMLVMQVADSGGAMVGYNNVKFDYPLLHMLMEHRGEITYGKLYRYGQRIIADGNRGMQWNHVIWDNDGYCPQIDLMMIHHFDNTAKLTSLKLLEYNMRMDDIQELPYSPHEDLTEAQAKEVLLYNGHDVKATRLFFEVTKPMLVTRYALSEKFNRDFTNFNDTKMGEQIVVETLKKQKVYLKKGDKTLRDFINVGEILFDYIEFTTPEFQQIHEFFKGAVIDVEKIKGFFGSRDKAKSKCQEFVDLETAMIMNHDDVQAVMTMSDGTTKRTAFKKWLENKDSLNTFHVKFKPVNIHCMVNGFRFDFGAGGIHGSVNNTVKRSTKNRKVRDSDVASYYPNIGIKNKCSPAHIGNAWCEVMDWMYHERLRVGKKTEEGGGYKLGLNGSYGKTNDEHSVMYDPQYTMTITINGQLLLCMLAEELITRVPEFEMIQINTDGLSYSYPPEHEPLVDEICKWWEDLTQLELEHVDYMLMAVRDVNNYLAVTKPYKTESGELKPSKIKRIGAYAHEHAGENPATRELPWHKNHSAVVVAKAAEAALVRNMNIESFIRNHLTVDPFDFYLRAKVPRSASLYVDTPVMWGDQVICYEREKTSNITRYYISNNGGKLIKEMTPTENQQELWLSKPHWRHKVSGQTKQSKSAPSGMWVQIEPPTKKRPLTQTNIDTGYLVTTANKLINGPDLSDINIDYYVAKARKLVDELLS